MTQDKANAIHYIGGEKLSEHKLEVIEDFEEVEDENKEIKE